MGDFARSATKVRKEIRPVHIVSIGCILGLIFFTHFTLGLIVGFVVGHIVAYTREVDNGDSRFEHAEDDTG